MEKSNREDIKIKIIFIGDTNVGKTSVIHTGTTDYFDSNYAITIGVDFKSKIYKINNLIVKAMFWDTAGAYRSHLITNPIYRKSNAVVICFSLNDRISFQNVDKIWIPDWKKNLNYDFDQVLGFLMGCKTDLQSQIPIEQILSYAQKNNLMYVQTSCKTKKGLHQSLEKIVTLATQSYKKYESNLLALNDQQNKNSLISFCLG